MFSAVPAKADIAQGISKANLRTLTMPACRRICPADPSLAVHCRGRDPSPIGELRVAWWKCPAGRSAISGAAKWSRLPVRDLTRSAGININERLLLRGRKDRLGWKHRTFPGPNRKAVGRSYSGWRFSFERSQWKSRLRTTRQRIRL